VSRLDKQRAVHVGVLILIRKLGEFNEELCLQLDDLR
jgi:hypothetical protein